MRIGILSTPNTLALGPVTTGLIANGIPVDCILLDSKGLSDYQVEYVRERTGGMLEPVPLGKLEDFHIPFFHLKSHLSDACYELVKERELDLLISASSPSILDQRILNASKIGIVGCHPGLLPRFRGSCCVEWAIDMDEPVGNTIYFLSKGIDEGPVVIQETIELTKKDTYQDVRQKAYLAGFDLLARGVRKIIDECLDPRKMQYQVGGKKFKTMTDKKLKTVMDKLQKGAYVYQI